MSPTPVRRSLAVRIAASIAGFVLLAVAIVFFWIPELALPLALVALRLLALQFAWAERAQGWLVLKFAELRGWFSKLSLLAKFAWCLVLAIVLVGIIALLFGR